MRKIYPLLIFIFPLAAVAQRPKPGELKDSIDYYQKKISKLTEQLTRSEQYVALQEGLDRALRRSGNYSGWTVFGNVVHSDYTQFNPNIAQNGFSPINALSYQLGLGSSSKTGRLIFDCNFFADGFYNTSDSGNEKIKTSLSDFFQLDLGVDLLRSNVISLYPYAGLGLRASELQYSKPGQTNTSYANISNIVNNDQSAHAYSFRVAYQVGIGLDFLTLKTNNGKDAIILFAKYGTDGPLWADKYKIDGAEYSPGFKQSEWVSTLGLKFVSRKLPQ